MTSPEPGHPAARARTGAGAVAAVALAALGLLLFTWPFVRTPPLGIGAAYLHLLGSWILVVAGLALLARALGNRGGAGDRDA